MSDKELAEGEIKGLQMRLHMADEGERAYKKEQEEMQEENDKLAGLIEEKVEEIKELEGKLLGVSEYAATLEATKESNFARIKELKADLAKERFYREEDQTMFTRLRRKQMEKRAHLRIAMKKACAHTMVEGTPVESVLFDALNKDDERGGQQI